MRLTAILLFISVSCFAQKKEVKKDSVQYHKYAKIEIQDLNLLFQGVQEYKRLLMYDTNIPEDKKPVAFRNIEAALIEIQKRISIDSIRVVH